MFKKEDTVLSEEKRKVKKELSNSAFVCELCTKTFSCKNRNKMNKSRCFDPMRELYDEKYALEEN